MVMSVRSTMKPACLQPPSPPLGAETLSESFRMMRRKHSCLFLLLFALHLGEGLPMGFLRPAALQKRHRLAPRKRHTNSTMLFESSQHGKNDKNSSQPGIRFASLAAWRRIAQRTSSRLLAPLTSTAVNVQEAEQQEIQTPTRRTESAHLKLHEHMTTTATTTSTATNNTDIQEQEGETIVNAKQSNATTRSQKVKIHSYTDPQTNRTYKALNTRRNKFYAYLVYNNLTLAQDDIVSQEQTLDDCNQSQLVRQEWRTLWKNRQLLTDRTELLAVYPSDNQEVNNGNSRKAKRGGFADLLHLYTERLIAILRDEQEDLELAVHSDRKEGSMLLDWLRKHYGEERTEKLIGSHFRGMDEKQQLENLKHFLEWFRSQFPYYYDRCGVCGASMKEDADQKECSNDESKTEDDSDEDNQVEDHQTFVGYIYPSEDEVLGKASRTELYQCHKCSSFTRFPRFNSAMHVMDHRRGRCGEYSMLLFRFLRALDHECRWVVDWADHVWAEIALTDEVGQRRWVHLDPCEAAVDENLIYQDWGKKQTYILGFYAPRQITHANGSSRSLPIPLIEDVTQGYTSDSWEEICKRREESEEDVHQSIKKAAGELKTKLINENSD